MPAWTTRFSSSARWSSLLCAAALLLNACGGGGTPAPRNETSRLPAADLKARTPAPDSVPSVNGPYAALPADGILVKFKDTSGNRAALDMLTAAGVHPVDHFDLVQGLTFAAVPENDDPTLALRSLQANPAVEYAEPNYIVTAFAMPNDPSLGRQYHLNQSSDADIDATEAWDLQTGTDVIIAVIDTGVDYSHPDLRNNIWTNPGEIAGNGRDDDGNGFVDDVRGWDFINNDNNPMDDSQHGTHVAGILAAEGNNGTGVSGVNWKARIMPIKFMGANGSGSTAAAIRAIQYAVANGARVSNNSWGGGAASQALRDAIAAANSRGHIFVAAAGNDGSNNDAAPTYPASYDLPNVISVAASTTGDGIATFSNFGARSVHVAAPGQSIFSTVPNGGYASLSGTSMAAPVVTGVVGLMIASNPSVTTNQIRTNIMSTADRPAGLSGRTASGRLNALRAVQSVAAAAPQPAPAPNPAPAPVPAPTPVSVTPGAQAVAPGTTLQLSATGGRGAPYTWSINNSTAGSVNQNTGLFTASRTNAGAVTVTATDSTGTRGSATITVTAVSITPDTGQLTVGQTLNLAATGGTPPYAWSSSNTGVASVNSQGGQVTAVGPGTATVTVTDANGAGRTTGNITVSAAAANVVITPASKVMAVGEKLTFSATGGSGPYTWSSSAPAVLAINAQGEATSQSTGTATLSVRDAGGNVATSGAITVRQVLVQASAASVMVGGTIELSATGGVGPYNWTSSNPAIASVGGSGGTATLTGVSGGSVTITVTDADGVRGTSIPITTTVNSAAISVSPATISVPARWWVRFSAAGATPPLTWSLSNPAAGMISSTTGWFHAGDQAGAKTAVIVTDANGNVNQSGEISVLASPVR